MSREPSKVFAAGVTGGALGALGGAAIGGAIDQVGWGVGAVVGAAVFGGLSVWADATRVPGRAQPLLVRIAGTAIVAAIAAALLELMLPAWPAVVPCAVIGATAGAIGLRPLKVMLGFTVGIAVGFAFDALAPDVGWAVSAASTVIVYRVAAAILWRGRDQIRIVGERVPRDQLPFVVPFSEATKYVGIDYLERYARLVGASFAHSPPDVGIVADFDDLAGTAFDPRLVDPVVREFYEHTSRFTLTITPEWKRRMRIPYAVYRATIARPIGQANVPFHQEEVQEGVMSWIDTVDVDGDGIADFRAWIRTYDTGEPLYVGIYTVTSIGGDGYVSVGFPLPAGNLTATLLPSNHGGTGVRLSSDADSPYSGHYISAFEDSGESTTLQLRSFGEELDVFVDHGTLRAEHRFSLGGSVFMTLHYRMSRKGSDLAQG